jgi:hypothetical protein
MPVPAVAAQAAGVATAIAYRVVSMLIAAVGAVYYFASRREIDRALKEGREGQGGDTVPAVS